MKLLTYKNQQPEPFEYTFVLDSSSPKVMVSLHCLLGANALHLVLLDDQNQVQLHAEIAAEDDESLDIYFIYQDSDIQVTCAEREVLLLSKDQLSQINAYYTVRPILVNPKAKGLLDIALVVDGTNHLLKAEKISKKKDNTSWRQLSKEIQSFIALFAKQYSTRVGVIAFADQPPPTAIRSNKLIPKYLLKPNAKDFSFSSFDQQQLETQIRQIESSSGCDYVDAVADALHACQSFKWRQKARRLVILVGDSPGYAILNPINKGCDINIRQYDVTIEALKLHQKKVEIISIFIKPSEKVKDLKQAKEPLAYTQKQYQFLASLADYAFQDKSFKATQAMDQIIKIKGLIGRNAMFGELIHDK